jgi:hypothetical protein
MLAQVARADQRGEPMVFLGWEPHPMNANFQMTYLSGGDDWFGPDFGGAEVATNTRAGYVAECPNVGKFLQNLEFTLAMENEIMGAILNDGRSGGGGQGMAGGQPRRGRPLAGRCDHQGRRRCEGGGGTRCAEVDRPGRTKDRMRKAPHAAGRGRGSCATLARDRRGGAWTG